MLAVWVSPIVLFLVLTATRHVSAMAAAILALVLSAAVVIWAGPVPVTPGAFAAMFVAGAFVALPAVLVILAGLYFTEVLNAAAMRGPADDPAAAISARDLGTTCLFLGPFVETATGFGVGYVVAVTGVMRAGVGPVGALGLGAFSQCLVPWGALGVGTQISASIAGVPLGDLTWRVAVVLAPMLWIMVVLYWRIARAAGLAINRSQQVEDMTTVVVLSLLLIVASAVLPIELAGLTAIGPVLLFRLWRSQGARLISSATLRRSVPYVILMLLLALTKLVPEVKANLSAHSFTPGEEAPAFAPLASPAISLILAAILGCLVHGYWRGLSDSVAKTMTKGARASIMTILLVALAWIIVRSGIAEAFADAMRALIGHHATLVVPVLGSLGGYLTGSNTGAGGLAMPVAKSVADNAELLLWVAAASIMAGSLLTALSPVRFAMGQAIANASKQEAGKALRLLLPFAIAAVCIAVLAVFLARIWISGQI